MIISITFICPETKEEVTAPRGSWGSGTVTYFEDWEEDYISIYRCSSCGKEHTFK